MEDMETRNSEFNKFKKEICLSNHKNYVTLHSFINTKSKNNLLNEMIKFGKERTRFNSLLILSIL